MTPNGSPSIPTTHAELEWELDDAWKKSARATAKVKKATEDHSHRLDGLFFDHTAHAGVEDEPQARRSWALQMKQRDLLRVEPFNVEQDLIDFTDPIYTNESGPGTGMGIVAGNSSVVPGTQVGSGVSAPAPAVSAFANLWDYNLEEKSDAVLITSLPSVNLAVSSSIHVPRQIPHATRILLSPDSRPAVEDLVILEDRSSQYERFLNRSEKQRELEFRRNEEDRQRIFLESQERRDREVRERADALWQELRNQFLVPKKQPSHDEESNTRLGDGISVPSESAATETASWRPAHVTETAGARPEEFAREHEEAAAEQPFMVGDRDMRIRTLEGELVQVRAELEAEKQRRLTEEVETRERERQVLIEGHGLIQQQLGSITNLVRRILGDLEADKRKVEEKKPLAESQPTLEVVIEELQRQSAEQRELLAALSESWRADSGRQHEETINAVRETAYEQVPFNVQRYIDEFSKALSIEIRMLFNEVGKLREEKYALQQKPSAPSSGPPPTPPTPPNPSAARSEGSRVRQNMSRNQKQRAAPVPLAAWTTWQSDPNQRRTLSSVEQTSWEAWQPDPVHLPIPPSAEPTLWVPEHGSLGLFGPRSPDGSYRG